MEPGVLNLNIEQGATYDQTITVRYKDTHALYDLSGYTSGALSIMQNWWSEDVKFSLTTSNGRLTLGGAAGTIRMLVASSDTASLPTTLGKFEGVYVLRLTSATAVDAFLRGKVYINQWDDGS